MQKINLRKSQTHKKRTKKRLRLNWPLAKYPSLGQWTDSQSTVCYLAACIFWSKSEQPHAPSTTNRWNAPITIITLCLSWLIEFLEAVTEWCDSCQINNYVPNSMHHRQEIAPQWIQHVKWISSETERNRELRKKITSLYTPSNKTNKPPATGQPPEQFSNSNDK